MSPPAKTKERAPLVALSFTGRNRDQVRPVAEGLAARYGKDAVFFDEWSRARLSTTDAGQRLEKKYRSARLVVVFLSEDYGQMVVKQRWTRLEWDEVYKRHVRRETDTVHLFTIDLAPEGLDALDLPGLSSEMAFPTAVEKRSARELVDDVVLRLDDLGVSRPDAGVLAPQAVWTAYRRFAFERHGHLSMIGVHTDAFRFSIHDVYVPLRLTAEVSRADLGGYRRDLKAEVPAEIGIEDVFRFVKPGEVPTVMGEAGSGKTTALKKLLALVLESRPDHKSTLFDKLRSALFESPTQTQALPKETAPILVRAADLKPILDENPGPARPTVGRQWLSGPLGHLVNVNLPGPFVPVLLAEDRPVLLLFDGLDELADPAQRTRALALVDAAVAGDEKLRAVVSCRHSARGYGVRFLPRFKTFEVRPLVDAQRRALTQRWFEAAFREQRRRDPEGQAKLFTESLFEELGPVFALDRHLRTLVSTPLFATLQCVLHLAGQSLPTDSVGFLMSALELLLERRHTLGVEQKPEDAHAGNLIRVLEEVALLIQKHNRQDGLTRAEWAKGWRWAVDREIPGRNDAAWRDWLSRHLDRPGRTLDDAAVRWLEHDADVLTEPARDQLIFRHRGFQEALAAARLVRHGEEGLKYLARNADGQTWREPFLYAVRLLGRERFGELARPLFERRDWPDLENVLEESLGLMGQVDPTPFIEALEDGDDRARVTVVRLFQGRPEAEQAALLAAAGRALDRAQAPQARQALAAFVGRAQHPEVMVEPTTGMRFLPVAGGTFEMGADDIGVSRPVHRVTVSSFWLAETPVTNAQYRPFVRASGKEPRYWSDRRYNQDEQPVVGVTWADAVAYCEWLTERLQKGFVARLPSEAWWERAARGDDGRRYPWGDAEPDETRAWYGQDWKSAPKPVGQYPAGSGPYGHLDLSGNVWEWCSDVWDGAAYKKRPHSPASVDPEVSEGDQAGRSSRGGGFNGDPDRLRAAYRGWRRAIYDGVNQGFRVCLAPLSTGGSGGGAP